MDGHTRPRWWAIPGGRALFTLSRRVRVLLVTVVVFLILLVLALTMPVPYVTLSPGPTFNTLGTDNSGNKIIVIKGHRANRITGHLNMTTVDVSTAPMTAFDAIVGWLQHDKVVVPKAAVYPPGESQHQTDEQNSKAFAQSQDSAVAAAACQLGYPKRLGVVSVASNGAAYKVLMPADLIEKVDGQAVGTPDALTAALASKSPGTPVTLQIVRTGKPKQVTVTLGPPITGRKGGSLGVEISQAICQLPFVVDLGLGKQIGGPSAGMMFALGIIDMVGSVDLTHGRFIAGTGTITPSGQVGPIGGIQLKMIAARRAGATVFLAPASNCPDVRGATPAGLHVIKVQTLNQAMGDLEALNAGKPVPHC